MKHYLIYIFGMLFLIPGCRKDCENSGISVLDGNGSIKKHVGTYGITMQKDPFDMFLSFYFDEGNIGKMRFYNSVISTYSDDLRVQMGEDNFQMDKSNTKLNLKYLNDPDNQNGLKDFAYFRDSYFNRSIPYSIILNGNQILKDSLFISGPLKFRNLENYVSQAPSMLFKLSKARRSLEYNASPGNKDGILLTMAYSGLTINSSFDDWQAPRKKPIVRVVFYEKDNGTLELPDELFKDIPIGAYLTFHINRGLCRKYDFDGKSHVIKFAFTNKLMMVLTD